MCGLIGFLKRQDSRKQFDLEAGIKALLHRGPDDRGVFVGEALGRRCGLGHARLSIIDLSPLGHQPMASRDQRYQIVFNGEVFNFADIRLKLEGEGVTFRSGSDTEVILEGYARWGSRVLQEMRGMFALAIWDSKSGALFLARDRMGIKPLYLVGDGQESLAFASEVRALLAMKAAARVLSPHGLASYLQWGSVAEPDTILRDVTMLAPGTCMFVEDGRVRVECYWQPRLTTTARSYAEAIEAVRPVLRKAVSLRLISDVPVGVFLSGGVDSSVVTAIAAETSSGPVHTFNVGFDEAAHDESQFASEFARLYGCYHHSIELSVKGALARIDDAMAAQDQPSVDGINTFFVSEAVKRAGITVALSGLGGDELFAGYDNFRRFGLARRAAGLTAGRGLLSPWVERLAGAVLEPVRAQQVARLSALLSGPRSALGAYSALRSMFTPAQVEGLLPPGVRNQTQRWPWYHEERFAEASLDDAAVFSVMEFRHYLKNTLLRDADIMSMAHSLEVRVPLLDHVLVETVLPLRAGFKLDPRNERNKPLLCDAAPTLPEVTSRRKKMGFTLPFDDWCRGDLRPYVEQTLLKPRLNLLDSAEVGKTWQRFLDGKINVWRVWCLAALIRWCELNGVEL